MEESVQQASAQLLMREMGLTDRDLENRWKIVEFGAEDLGFIAAVKDLVVLHAEEYTTEFFDYLSNLDEARGLMASRAILERARQLEQEHLVAMVQGEYGSHYVEQRLELAMLYSKAGLALRIFLGALRQLMRNVGITITKQFERTPLAGFESFMSFKKVAFFDLAIMVDVVVFERERVIRHQQEAIRELSTPVLQIRERLLLLPVIGVIDTHRARLLTEGLLRSIRESRAKVVVMDVTGVATIDSKVANYLFQTVAAARLMGATVIVTGLSADVAQSLVSLGIELSGLHTVGDLQGGIEEAERLLGYRVHRAAEPVRAAESP